MSEIPAHFGPYEILAPLGAGGMGKVYRARDGRLQRHVALKILHDAASLDDARRKRFAQEAIAASALNHPNILAVYDIGVDGETPYLVSELIDGTSLRSEMNAGRFTVERALDVAMQTAEGLAAAHAAGIVHRDLKPENVMVTRDGRIKIVDFGLAKISDDPAALQQATTTQTAAGLIVGTVPYMSPEQARGEPADFRADQFALGVMLYEMVTAVHPFKRDTPVQTLSAIIGDEPADPQASASGTGLPTPVWWLIRRLLAKAPRDRYAHTADLVTDLRNLRTYRHEAPRRTSTGLASGRWRAALVAAALVAGGLVVGGALARPDAPASFTSYKPLATDAGYQGMVAWSPDGRQIAYEAEANGVTQIFTRTLGAAQRVPVTDVPAGAYDPIWSSDGYIYFHSQARDQNALWRITPVGGEAQLVAEGAAGSAIAPDGRTLFFLKTESALTTRATLWMASPPTAPGRRYTEGALAERTGAGGLVRFSPDGTKVLLWMGPQGDSNGTFFLIPVAGGEPSALPLRLGDSGQAPPYFTWLADNRHFVVARSDGPSPGTHLWVADTAGTSMHPLTFTPGNETTPSAAPDGRTIAFSSTSTDFDLVEVPLDGSALQPFLSSTRNEYDPTVSPTSTQFAFVTDRTGRPQIWLQNQEGYLQQPLVTESDFKGTASVAMGSLAFSPDGRRLAFQRAGPNDPTRGGSRLWIVSVAGGPLVPVGNDSESFQDAPTWSSTGEWLAYLVGEPEGGGFQSGNLRLVKERIGASGVGTRVVLASDVLPFVARPQWSPDGRSILCETIEGLTIFAADGSGSRVISASGWLAYGWSDDARHVYGLRATDDGSHFMLVSVNAGTGAERVLNANLGILPQAIQPIRGFSRLRGRGFLTSIARVRSDIHLIEGFRLPRAWWQRVWPFGSS